MKVKTFENLSLITIEKNITDWFEGLERAVQINDWKYAVLEKKDEGITYYSVIIFYKEVHNYE